MTPKEKAKELISENFDLIAKAINYKELKFEGENKFYALEKAAKECSLLTANKIIEERFDFRKIATEYNNKRIKFWTEVRNELEKNRFLKTDEL